MLAEQLRRRVEVLRRERVLAAALGDFGQALVAAASLHRAAFALRPFEAAAVVLLGLVSEVEAQREPSIRARIGTVSRSTCSSCHMAAYPTF